MKTPTLQFDIVSPFRAKMGAPVRRERMVPLALAHQVIQGRTAAPLSLAANTTLVTTEPPAMSVVAATCVPVCLDTEATTASFCCQRFPKVSLWWMAQIADIQRV